MQDLLGRKMTSTDAAIAFIKRGNAVLMGLREYRKGQPVWTYPGGRGEPGETVQEALVREVFEEIGVTDLSIASYLKRLARSGDMHGRCPAAHRAARPRRRRPKARASVGEKPGVKQGDRVYFFQCVTNQQPALKEPEKFLEWRWVDLQDLPTNLIDPGDKAMLAKMRASTVAPAP